MNERIREIAEQAGLEWVEVMEAWLADDENIERFYEMVFEAGRMVGFKQDKALTELARIGQEIEQAQNQEPEEFVRWSKEKEFFESCQTSRKEWVGLTDEEYELHAIKHAPPVHPDFIEDDSWLEFAKALEHKLKEKNT